MSIATDPKSAPMVFLSHASEDKPAVRRLGDALEKRGLRVWLDEKQINVGDSIVERLEDGLEKCDYLVIWLTPASVNSKWVQVEWQGIFGQSIKRGRPQVLPALAGDCELPFFLEGRLYADFRKSFDAGLDQLTKALASTSPEIGFLRPTSPPASERLPMSESFPESKNDAMPSHSGYPFDRPCQAQVAMVIIPGLTEDLSRPAHSFSAIHHLHRSLETFVDGERVRITSALHGAIIVIRNTPGSESDVVDLRELLPRIVDCLKITSVPFRIGVAFGWLFPVADADGSQTFVGAPVNRAARLAAAPENQGVLFDSSYVKGFSTTGGIRADAMGWEPSEIEPTVKYHDSEGRCFRDLNATEGGPSLPSAKPLAPVDPVSRRQGVCVAMDLGKFSAGRADEISRRFANFVRILGQRLSAHELSEYFYSPGGDGGILVILANQDRVVLFVEDLVKHLKSESAMLGKGCDIRCRVAIHSSPEIPLYINAESLVRPTGVDLFLADGLAHDLVPGGWVASESLHDTLASGLSDEEFAQTYPELPPLEGLSSLRRWAPVWVQRIQLTESLPLEETEEVFQQAHAVLLKKIQRMVDQNPDVLGPLLSEVFPDNPNDISSNLTNVEAALGAINRTYAWIEEFSPKSAESSTLICRFCAALALCGVRATWILQQRNQPHVTISETETVRRGGDFNLPYWSAWAVQRILDEPLSRLDLKDLLISDQDARFSAEFSCDILPSDPTGRSRQNQLMNYIIDLTGKSGDESADLSDQHRVEFFEESLEYMTELLELGEPYLIWFRDYQRTGEAFQILVDNKVVHGKVGFIFCKSPDTEKIVPKIVSIVVALRKIRDRLNPTRSANRA